MAIVKIHDPSSSAIPSVQRCILSRSSQLHGLSLCFAQERTIFRLEKENFEMSVAMPYPKYPRKMFYSQPSPFKSPLSVRLDLSSSQSRQSAFRMCDKSSSEISSDTNSTCTSQSSTPKPKRKRQRSAQRHQLVYLHTMEESYSLIRVWRNRFNSFFYDCICNNRKPIQDLKKIKKHITLHLKSEIHYALCLSNMKNLMRKSIYDQ